MITGVLNYGLQVSLDGAGKASLINLYWIGGSGTFAKKFWFAFRKSYITQALWKEPVPNHGAYLAGSHLKVCIIQQMDTVLVVFVEAFDHLNANASGC